MFSKVVLTDIPGSHQHIGGCYVLLVSRALLGNCYDNLVGRCSEVFWVVGVALLLLLWCSGWLLGRYLDDCSRWTIVYC